MLLCRTLRSPHAVSTTQPCTCTYVHAPPPGPRSRHKQAGPSSPGPSAAAPRACGGLPSGRRELLGTRHSLPTRGRAAWARGMRSPQTEPPPPPRTAGGGCPAHVQALNKTPESAARGTSKWRLMTALLSGRPGECPGPRPSHLRPLRRATRRTPAGCPGPGRRGPLQGCAGIHGDARSTPRCGGPSWRPALRGRRRARL